MKRLFATFCIAAGLLVGFATSAGAVESEEVVELRIDVPSADSDNPDVRRQSRKKIAERVIERIRERLNAAQVKYTNVHIVDGGTVVVESDPDFDRQLLEALIFPPGNFALRPVVPSGRRWTDLTAEMPAGVELRAGDDPLDSDSAYAWSRSRRTLQSFVDEVSMPEGEVAVYPAEGGWRTVTLGEAIVTDANVSETEIRRVQTGSPFVSVSLSSGGDIGPSDGPAERRDRRLAVVLDGEVVALLKENALAGQTLSISAPDHMSGANATMRWARQVAGRLAATMPVSLVPMQTDGERDDE
jgi:preprotein translocase subunit SecD